MSILRKVILFTIVYFTFVGCLYAQDDIDNNLISAIIQVESGGNPNAVSEDGCIGLMQLSLIALREYYENDGTYVLGNTRYPRASNIGGLYEHIWESEFNVYLGSWYLRRLKDHYLKDHYTIERMLAAYNGGITRLRKVNYDISKMPYETRQYVKRVMTLISQIVLKSLDSLVCSGLRCSPIFNRRKVFHEVFVLKTLLSLVRAISR